MPPVPTRIDIKIKDILNKNGEIIAHESKDYQRTEHGYLHKKTQELHTFDFSHFEVKTPQMRLGKYRLNNAFLTFKLYTLFGENLSKQEFITAKNSDNKFVYGVRTVIYKDEDVVTFKDIKDIQTKKNFYDKAQEGFLIDVLLANYNVVGRHYSNLGLTKEGNILRRSTDGALEFDIDNKLKNLPEESKTPSILKVDEFEYMHTGKAPDYLTSKVPTAEQAINNSREIFNPGGDYKSIYESPVLLKSLKKLMSVTDPELVNCIQENSFASFQNDKDGEAVDKYLIDTLLVRREVLKYDALKKIILCLKDKNVEERVVYLKEAGIDQDNIKKICDYFGSIALVSLDSPGVMKTAYDLILNAIKPNKNYNILNQKLIDLVDSPERLNKLIHLCEGYLEHLGPPKTTSTDHLFAVKRHIVSDMLSALKEGGNNSKIKDMANIFFQHKEILKESRSGKIKWFLEQILSVLTGGLYTKLTKKDHSFFSQTHGQVLSKKIEELLSPNSSKPPDTVHSAPGPNKPSSK